MAIPRIAKQIKKSDFTLRPVTVNKQFNLPLDEITSEKGYLVRKGYHSGIPVPINDVKSDNDLKNTDGSFQAIIWSSLNHMFYNDPYNPSATFEHVNRYKTYKYISPTLSHISIPYLDLGEALKKNSVELINYNYLNSIIDDGNGNLIDREVPTSLAEIWNNNHLVSYWSFNDLYKDVLRWNSDPLLEDGDYAYDFPFNADTMTSEFKGISLIKSKSYEDADTRGAISTNDGYIRTAHNDHFNLIDDDFLIHMKIELTSHNNGTILSKNGVKKTKKIGLIEEVTDKGIKIRKKIYYEDEHVATNIYPYNLSIDTGVITFTRSDGKNLTKITIPAVGESWIDLIICRYTDSNVPKLSIFLNGSLVETVTDNTISPYNDYDLLFGTSSILEGSARTNVGLDEIRFYNNSFYDSSTVLELMTDLSKTQNMFYTNVIGNVFYRSGNIVITTPFSYYDTFLDNIDLLRFKSTHMIYEYEVLCRINKGEFNLTLNPTARIYKSSDQLNSDFTDGGLKPYISEIGLYNEAGELLVVAKLAQPVMSRDDVNINILIKWEA